MATALFLILSYPGGPLNAAFSAPLCEDIFSHVSANKSMTDILGVYEAVVNAETLNRRAGLEPQKSAFVFKDFSDPILLSKEDYHRALAEGVVPLQEPHDFTYHAVGFALLAKSPIGFKIRMALQEAFALEHSGHKINLEAKRIRQLIGSWLEVQTSNLTSLDFKKDLDGVQSAILSTEEFIDSQLKILRTQR